MTEAIARREYVEMEEGEDAVETYFGKGTVAIAASGHITR